MKKISQEELDERVRQHSLWLQDKDGERLDLSYHDLERLDLSDSPLKRAIFIGAKLRSANFQLTNLFEAELEDADLREADFRNSNLREACLSFAMLNRADFRCSTLGGADFVGAAIEGAHLEGAIINDAFGLPTAPKIENIDRKLLEVLNADKHFLDVKSCYTHETTLGRLGWYIKIAEKEGQSLERNYGRSVAGALIFHASYPNKRIPDWYASDEQALEDIRRNAYEED